jgi:S1-C subfamily serine protease
MLSNRAKLVILALVPLVAALVVLASPVSAAAAEGKQAIPASGRTAGQVSGQVSTAEGGKGYLGVYLSEDEKGRKGALVEGVAKGSPAAEAGLKKGDYIIRYNRTKIRNSNDLIRILLRAKAGDRVRFRITRKGWEKDLLVIFGARVEHVKPEKPKFKEVAFLGVYLKEDDSGKGALIDGTVPGSPAFKAGLKKGDYVVRGRKRRIRNVRDFQRVLGRMRPKDVLRIVVNREGWQKVFEIPMASRKVPVEPEKVVERPKRTVPKKPTIKKFEPGFLGVALLETESGVGVKVDEIAPGSPASRADLNVGDVIVLVKTTKPGARPMAVNSPEQFGKVVGQFPAGTALHLVVQRQGWRRDVTVRLGRRPGRFPEPERPVTPPAPPRPPKPFRPGFLGVRLGLTDEGGVVVGQVIPGTAAEKAHLMPGDLVLRLNGKKVEDIESMVAMLKGVGAGGKVHLKLKRGDSVIDKTVVLGERPTDLPKPEMPKPPKPEMPKPPKPEMPKPPKPEMPKPPKPEPPKPVPPKPEVPEKKKPGFLGITPVETDEEKGLLIEEVVKGSPAHEAGIRKGDLLLFLDGKRIKTLDDLVHVWGKRYAGDAVLLVIRHKDGSQEKIKVTLAERK